MTKALRPLVWLLEASAELALRPFGVRQVIAGETMRNAEELRAIVDEAEGAGVILRAQEQMLHDVFARRACRRDRGRVRRSERHARARRRPNGPPRGFDDYRRLHEAMGTEFDTAHALTPAGLVFNELGRRPREGDEVQVGGVRLQVDQLDGHRITRLLAVDDKSRKTRDDESSARR